MITDPFDPGPSGAFAALCQEYPDGTVFPGSHGFRSLWGPIFYRGRADGSARLLVMGQDPAQTEAFTRRILSGQAGRRVQGFVEKLGYTHSYLMVNAFLYGILNQQMAVPHLNDPEILAYRNKCLEAAFEPGKIEAVVTFGTPAFHAWEAFTQTPAGAAAAENVAFHKALHPTADKPGGPISRQDLLENWNFALRFLHSRIEQPDVSTPLVEYGDDFTTEELPPIPSADLPFGIPAWMRESDFWASMPRKDDPQMVFEPGTERANIYITVP